MLMPGLIWQLIPSHNDIDPAGIKHVMRPLLWTVEERLWKAGKNLPWQNTAPPDFKTTLYVVPQGAKETWPQVSCSIWNCGFIGTFEVDFPHSNSYTWLHQNVHSVWSSLWIRRRSICIRKSAGFLKTRMSGPCCEQSKEKNLLLYPMSHPIHYIFVSCKSSYYLYISGSRISFILD